MKRDWRNLPDKLLQLAISKVGKMRSTREVDATRNVPHEFYNFMANEPTLIVPKHGQPKTESSPKGGGEGAGNLPQCQNVYTGHSYNFDQLL